jgi:hypothetical protein
MDKSMKDSPRIAILFHGNSGRTDSYGTCNKLDPEISYSFFKNRILDINKNVDVFFHCWDTEEEKKLKSLYKPVSTCFEEQIIFDFEYIVGDPDGPGGEINRWKDGKFKGLDNLRFHSLFSRWYSAMKVNHMKRTYEIDNGFRYDFVMLTRPDLAYSVDFDFRKFNKDSIYHVGPVSDHHGIHDLWFISNSSQMDKFTQMYEVVKDVKHFPHKFWHSHQACLSFFKTNKMYEKLRSFGEPRYWGMGAETKKLGPSPLVRSILNVEGQGKKKGDDSHMSRERDRIKERATKRFR